MEKDSFELSKMVETYNNNVREIDQDLKGDNAGGGSASQNDSKKYEVLYQKE